MGAMRNLRGYEIFNLGESKTVPLRELISLIEKALGKKAAIEELPDQPGDVPITYADISKARRLLGYDPKVGIEEGVKRFVQWFRDKGEGMAS
jgi:UDP-glucuronate 4-epimerase